MNTKSFAMAVAATFVGLSTVSLAQSRIVINVPFAYTTTQNTLPPGEYTVRTDLTNGMVKIVSSDFKHMATLIGHGVQPSLKGDHPAGMTFTRYGDQYFLTRVWAGGSPAGVELNKSRAEREQIAALGRTVTLSATR